MSTATTIKKTTWNTYRVTGYMGDIGVNDQASAGGVILHQVRKTVDGWEKRQVQSNGRHHAAAESEQIDDAEGQELFARAKAY